MMAGIYAAMLIFFMNAYGGFKIGYLRKGNLDLFSGIVSDIYEYIHIFVSCRYWIRNCLNLKWF